MIPASSNQTDKRLKLNDIQDTVNIVVDKLSTLSDFCNAYESGISDKSISGLYWILTDCIDSLEKMPK